MKRGTILHGIATIILATSTVSPNAADFIDINYLAPIKSSQKTPLIKVTSALGSVAFSDSILFVTTTTPGIAVFDVSTPASPVFLTEYHFQGKTASVATSGSNLYLTEEGQGIVILNVDQPSELQEVGVVEIPGDPYLIEVLLNHLMVVTITGELYLFDLDDPNSPNLVTTYSSITSRQGGSGPEIQSIVAVEPHVYITSWYKIHEINLENPSSPPLTVYESIQESSFSPAAIFGFTLMDNIAYLATLGDGLKVVDLFGGDMPETIGSLKTDGLARDVITLDDYSYVAASSTGLEVFDTSDPRVPALVRTIPLGGWTQHVHHHESILAVLDGWEGLVLFSLTDPASPKRVATIGGSRSASIAFHERQAYVGEPAGGITVVNLADVFSLKPHHQIAKDRFVEAMDVQGDLMYVAAGDDGLVIFDVSDPANPLERGSLETKDYASDVAAIGSRVFLADRDEGLFRADVTDPETPEWGNSLGIGDGSGLIKLAAGTSDLCAINLDGNLRIYRDAVSKDFPLEIRVEREIVPLEKFVDVGCHLNYAYVVGESGKIWIIDMGVSPTAIRGSFIGGESIDVEGDRLVTTGRKGTFVYDLEDPEQPQLIGYKNDIVLDRGAYATTDGERLILGDHQTAPQIHDISVPAPIQPRGSTAIQHGHSSSFTIEDRRAYIAHGSTGISVVDLTNPDFPQAAAHYPTLDNAFQAIRSGATIFVADGNAGLTMIDLTGPATTSLETAGQAARVIPVGDSMWVASQVSSDTGEERVVEIFSAPPGEPVSKTGEIDSLRNIQINDTCASGNTLLVAAQNTVLLFETSVSPPELLGTLTMDRSITGVAASADLFATVDKTLVAIHDISDRSNPNSVAYVDTIEQPTDVALDGRRAYVLDGSNRIHVVDLSDPAIPIVMEGIGFRSSGRIEITNDQLYFGDESNGGDNFHVMDLHKPKARIFSRLSDDRSSIEIHAIGTTSAEVTIETSADLEDWQEHATIRLTEQPIQLPTALNDPKRFFRKSSVSSQD